MTRPGRSKMRLRVLLRILLGDWEELATFLLVGCVCPLDVHEEVFIGAGRLDWGDWVVLGSEDAF